MKTKLIRSVAFLLLCVFILSAFAGCETDGATTNTQESANTNETEKSDETPKGPLDLNGYRVIIPDHATDKSVESLVAYELKAMLADIGYSVRVKEDDGATSFDEPVILLGKTAATAENMPAGNAYSIKESNGTVQISAGNYYGYTAALKLLKTKIKASKGFPRDLDQTGTAKVSSVDRKSDDSIRVMFYNIFGWNNWPKASYDKNGTPLQQNGSPVTNNSQVYKQSQSPATAPPEALRQDLQNELIAAYAPDVLGFMEYMSTDVWTHGSLADFHGNLTALLEDLGYTSVPAGGPDGEEKANCTPMFYNADKLELLDCGYTLYRSTNDDWKSKSVTWGVFREKASGKLFSVFNTHFAHEDGEVGDLAREDNAKEFLEVKAAVLAKKTEYNDIPVIMGGDLNFWNIWGNYDNQTGDKANDRISQTKPYKALTNGGMIFAANVSGVETNGKSGATNYVNTYHGYSDYNATKRIYDVNKKTIYTPYTLDYIFLENRSLSKLSVEKYMIIEDDITKRASDHCPVFVDFVLK